jgi:hypothetical protein
MTEYEKAGYPCINVFVIVVPVVIPLIMLTRL